MQPKSTARRKRMDVPFWERVDKNGPVPDHCPDLGPCWVWIAGTNMHGYGKMVDPTTKRLTAAHRMSWAETYGPIPDDLHVLHRCDTRSCVRPDHLFLGTHRDNMDDMVAKGRATQTRPYGERHKDARLTVDLVRAIRYQYQVEGARITDIAAERNVSKKLIWKVVHRKSWVHVP